MLSGTQEPLGQQTMQLGGAVIPAAPLSFIKLKDKIKGEVTDC